MNIAQHCKIVQHREKLHNERLHSLEGDKHEPSTFTKNGWSLACKHAIMCQNRANSGPDLAHHCMFTGWDTPHPQIKRRGACNASNRGWLIFSAEFQIHGFVQKRHDSNVQALELHLLCIKPQIHVCYGLFTYPKIINFHLGLTDQQHHIWLHIRLEFTSQ